MELLYLLTVAECERLEGILANEDALMDISLKNLRLGFLDSFPACCIFEYSDGLVLSKAMLSKASGNVKGTPYVPCRKCEEAIICGKKIGRISQAKFPRKMPEPWLKALQAHQKYTRKLRKHQNSKWRKILLPKPKLDLGMHKI